VQLVKLAIEQKRKSPKGDIFWVVYDRESPPKYSHELHLLAAKNANDNGVEIALSNVCFELWLLLHLDYSTASYGNCDSLKKNSVLNDFLKSKNLHSKNEHKAAPLLFEMLRNNHDKQGIDGVAQALRRAAKLKKNMLATAELGKEAPCYLNPLYRRSRAFCRYGAICNPYLN